MVKRLCAVFIVFIGLFTFLSVEYVHAQTYTEGYATISTGGQIDNLISTVNSNAIGNGNDTEDLFMGDVFVFTGTQMGGGTKIYSRFGFPSNPTRIILASPNGTNLSGVASTTGYYNFVIVNYDTDLAVAVCIQNSSGVFTIFDCTAPVVFDQTTFYDLLPPTNTIVASTTVELGFSLYRDGDEDLQRYTQSCIRVYPADFIGSSLWTNYCFDTAYSGNGTFATTTMLHVGQYFTVYLLYDPVDDIYADYSFAPTGDTSFTVLRSIADNLQAIINKNLVGTSTYEVSCDEVDGYINQLTCALGKILSDVLQFLFVPNAYSLNKYNEFFEVIKSKPPISYFYQTKDTILLFQNATTSPYSLGTSSAIMVNIITPTNNALSIAIYSLGLIWLYKWATRKKIL